jgi:hypothetical protein
MSGSWFVVVDRFFGCLSVGCGGPRFRIQDLRAAPPRWNPVLSGCILGRRAAHLNPKATNRDFRDVNEALARRTASGHDAPKAA